MSEFLSWGKGIALSIQDGWSHNFTIAGSVQQKKQNHKENRNIRPEELIEMIATYTYNLSCLY